MAFRPCLFCTVCICTLLRCEVLFLTQTPYEKMSAPQIGTLHRKWKKGAFFLETVVLTKVTRRRYFAGRIAAKKPRSAVVATHDRELGKVKISPTIGLYTPIHKKQKLGVLSELDRKWWPRPGSNRRHTDFQSVALPTELPSHKRVGQVEMVGAQGFEPWTQ